MISFPEYSLNIVENWKYSIPVNFEGDSIIVKKDYYKNCKKNNPISHMWIVFAIGMIKYNKSFNILNDTEKFPKNKIYKFAFCYMFYYIKNICGIKNFYFIVDNDITLAMMSIKYKESKEYFDSCEHYLKWEIK